MTTERVTIPQKQCADCKIWKPATLEYFHEGKRYTYGVRSQCRECATTNRNVRKKERIENVQGQIQCTACLEWKLPTIEFFRPLKNTSSLFEGRCKVCESKAIQEREAKKPKKYRHAKPGAKTKICPKCHLEKPLHCFYPGQRGILKVASQCSMCQNPLKPGNLIQKTLPLIRTCNVCQQEKNIERFYPSQYEGDCGFTRKCKDCSNEKSSQRYYNNHEERRIKSQQYNARKAAEKIMYPNARRDFTLMRNAEVSMRKYAEKLGAAIIDVVDYPAIFKRDNNFCYLCQKDILRDQRIAFDHIIPLSRGGFHTTANIKLAHFVCNNRKSNNLPSEITWFQKRGVE